MVVESSAIRPNASKLGQWRLRQPQGQVDSVSGDVVERGHPVVQQRTSLGNCCSHYLHDHCLGLVVAPP